MNAQTGGPSILSIEPNSVEVQYGGVVKIHGSGFAEGSTVNFEGGRGRAYLDARYRSPQLLEVQVKRDLTFTSDTLQVTVSHGGKSSNAKPFTVLKGKS
jgi:IPT/TIG domain